MTIINVGISIWSMMNVRSAHSFIHSFAYIYIYMNSYANANLHDPTSLPKMTVFPEPHHYLIWCVLLPLPGPWTPPCIPIQYLPIIIIIIIIIMHVLYGCVMELAHMYKRSEEGKRDQWEREREREGTWIRCGSHETFYSSVYACVCVWWGRTVSFIAGKM